MSSKAAFAVAPSPSTGTTVDRDVKAKDMLLQHLNSVTGLSASIKKTMAELLVHAAILVSESAPVFLQVVCSMCVRIDALSRAGADGPTVSRFAAGVRSTEADLSWFCATFQDHEHETSSPETVSAVDRYVDQLGVLNLQSLLDEYWHGEVQLGEPCPDCGTLIIRFAMQLRGLDEGMTTIEKCLNCGDNESVKDTLQEFLDQVVVDHRPANRASA